MSSCVKFFLSVLMIFGLSVHPLQATESELGLSIVKVKMKKGWTEATIAIENKTDHEVEFQCCKTFLENTDGFSVASLNQQEVQTQIFNRAQTGSRLGYIIGGGLGLAGLISGKEELGYAGLGVAGVSAIADTVGHSSEEASHRELVIDDVMRNHDFPPGLKVAGIAYFPPKNKWPGSKKLQAIHLTYKINGQSQTITAPIY